MRPSQDFEPEKEHVSWFKPHEIIFGDVLMTDRFVSELQMHIQGVQFVKKNCGKL